MTSILDDARSVTRESRELEYDHPLFKRRFSDEEEAHIGRLYEEGFSYPRINRDFGISYGLIGGILKRLFTLCIL